MKRLILVGAVLASLSAPTALAWPGVKAIAAERERAAGREASALLRRFVPPPGAARLARGPRLPATAWPSSGPTGKFAVRERYWRTSESIDAVVAFVQAHPPRAMTSQPASSGPGFRILDFGSRGTRYLDVTALRHAGRTFVRVQADVVWIYPRSPEERVPAGVTEIDVRAPKVSRHVTGPAKVATIVRWFDALPISPPGVVLPCPLVIGPKIEFVFRSASGARLASASAPSLGKAWICDAIAFSIHGHRQTALVDAQRGHGFVYRVQHLLGVTLLEKR
ncbi:MAG TPA: hypothetical protein VKR79_08655 [Gaiellaceae bacterium]|nr:hypothetical protein [Gaiellaceae bacterium]